MIRGEVMRVRFALTDLAMTKKRPALVLARIIRSRRNRLVVVATIGENLVDKRIGKLSFGDLRCAGEAFRGMFSAWVR